MGIISNITAKDIFILIMGGTVGYLINLIVAAQTAKKKKLSVELISRETKLDEEVDKIYWFAAITGKRSMVKKIISKG